MDILFWRDYFNTLGEAIKRLEEVVHHKDIDKNDYIQDAVIQRFEFVMEMFWRTLKKVLSYEKIESITPRDTLSKAFQFQLIDDEAIWLKMLDDRNRTSHIYSQTESKEIFENIKTYLPIFQKSYACIKNSYKL
jgi:nucleotidyltransferase substrate binding protein (TIGR01987 family)